MQPEEYLHWFEVEASAFDRVLASSDLSAPVVACPGWDVAALAGHLGEVHRWSRQKVRGDDEADRTPAPNSQPELSQWFTTGAAALLQTLRSSSPQAPCWTMAPPRTALFWMRRQAHETAMHRFDAQRAIGSPDPFDAGLAADGVAEIVEVFFPRQVRLGRQAPLACSLGIEIDGGPSYLLSGDGSAAGGVPDAVVSGPAEALLLLLWKRTSRADVRITLRGSPAAVDAVLAASITP